MDNIDLEALRLAMFAHPGVKAVAPDLRLYRAVEGSMGVAATIHLAAPDVDQTTVQATTEEIRAHKNALYQLLKNRNEAAEIQLFTQIGEAQMKIEKLHFEHFLAIKALCTAEQLPLFDELTTTLAQLFAPSPQKN